MAPPVGGVDRVGRILKDACDAASSRMSKRGPSTAMFWWNEEIAEARCATISAKRAWNRCKRRRDQTGIEGLARSYRAARRNLRRMINRAKRDSWKDLIQAIDEDPWGLPYKIVLNKLRRSTPSLTETLNPVLLEDMMDALFPRGDGWVAPEIGEANWSLDEQDAVSPAEIHFTVTRKGIRNTAPGPDGMRALVLKKIPDETIFLLAECFTACLRDGCFPEPWKWAYLSLIPKAGSSRDRIPKVRPICLLSDVGKTFERIIVTQMKEWMRDNPQADLSDRQYGFREGRSTCDALLKVRGTVEDTVAEGSVVIAVSLDIANAFNTITWRAINEALERKGFPIYIRRIVNAYFSERKVEYLVGDGSLRRRDMMAGVPQGLVVGPLLWNIAYNSVLEGALEEGCTVLCYADDTIILTPADSVEGARVVTNVQVSRTLMRIQRLGLTVAEAKTEVVLFHGRNRPNEFPRVQVGDSEITAGSSMKYRGIMLDSRLSFRSHFEYIVAKATRVNRALCRLMPNLRGPGEAKRQLYARTLQSIILYGALVWSDKLTGRGANWTPIRRLQRTLAVRVIAA